MRAPPLERLPAAQLPPDYVGPQYVTVDVGGLTIGLADGQVAGPASAAAAAAATGSASALAATVEPFLSTPGGAVPSVVVPDAAPPIAFRLVPPLLAPLPLSPSAAAGAAAGAALHADWLLPADATRCPSLRLDLAPLRLTLAPELLHAVPRHLEAWAPPPDAARHAEAPAAEEIHSTDPEEGERVRARLLGREANASPVGGEPAYPVSARAEAELKPPTHVSARLQPSAFWLLLPKEAPSSAERLGLRLELGLDVGLTHPEDGRGAEARHIPAPATSRPPHPDERSVRLEGTLQHVGSGIYSLTWPPAEGDDEIGDDEIGEGRLASGATPGATPGAASGAASGAISGAVAIGAPLVAPTAVHVSAEVGAPDGTEARLRSATVGLRASAPLSLSLSTPQLRVLQELADLKPVRPRPYSLLSAPPLLPVPVIHLHPPRNRPAHHRADGAGRTRTRARAHAPLHRTSPPPSTLFCCMHGPRARLLSAVHLPLATPPGASKDCQEEEAAAQPQAAAEPQQRGGQRHRRGGRLWRRSRGGGGSLGAEHAARHAPAPRAQGGGCHTRGRCDALRRLRRPAPPSRARVRARGQRGRQLGRRRRRRRVAPRDQHRGGARTAHLVESGSRLGALPRAHGDEPDDAAGASSARGCERSAPVDGRRRPRSLHWDLTPSPHTTRLHPCLVSQVRGGIWSGCVQVEPLEFIVNEPVTHRLLETQAAATLALNTPTSVAILRRPPPPPVVQVRARMRAPVLRRPPIPRPSPWSRLLISRKLVRISSQLTNQSGCAIRLRVRGTEELVLIPSGERRAVDIPAAEGAAAAGAASVALIEELSLEASGTWHALPPLPVGRFGSWNVLGQPKMASGGGGGGGRGGAAGVAEPVAVQCIVRAMADESAGVDGPGVAIVVRSLAMVHNATSAPLALQLLLPSGNAPHLDADAGPVAPQLSRMDPATPSAIDIGVERLLELGVVPPGASHPIPPHLANTAYIRVKPALDDDSTRDDSSREEAWPWPDALEAFWLGSYNHTRRHARQLARLQSAFGLPATEKLHASWACAIVASAESGRPLPSPPPSIPLP